MRPASEVVTARPRPNHYCCWRWSWVAL